MLNKQRAKNGHATGPRVAGHVKSPSKMSVNDDLAEKDGRRFNDKAQEDLKRKGAPPGSTPVRKHRHSIRSVESSPMTPGKRRDGNKRQSLTPLPKVPVLANFEEWMKMATDNKITATNSWNFALIDYFHEMSLLKEGDGINFQKASCTLDGCVKIYTSRIDSVITETGKLLSGLAANRSKQAAQEAQDDEDADDEDENGEHQAESNTKKTKRSTAVSTLVKDYSSLKAKKYDLEFTVDPLFKKMSADFDEGGAKGLLMNHLSVDHTGRVIFDSSDSNHPANMVQNVEDEWQPSAEIDLSGLARFLEPLENEIEDLHVCPSLMNFDFGDKSGSLDISLLKGFNDEDGDGNEFMDQPPLDFDDGDAASDAALGEGESAAGGADPFGPGVVYETTDAFDPIKHLNGSELTVGFGDDDEDKEGDIFSYFDNALKKNWAGPQHWKIQNLKSANDTSGPNPEMKRKRETEKEAFQIDFLGDQEVDFESLFAPGGSSTQLPKSHWKTRAQNLLPDDIHFNSKQLLRLFLKPEVSLRTIRRKKVAHGPAQPIQEQPVNAEPALDEHYWAEQNGAAQEETEAGFDANFFDEGEQAAGPDLGHDEDDDFEGFEDAQENINGVSVKPENVDEGFGSQLIAGMSHARPDYVKYAKTAKRVDVKRLKDNLWEGLSIDLTTPEPQSRQTPEAETQPEERRKFSEVVGGLNKVYPSKQLNDISTSFCFICLLHLANEKGLEIKGDESLNELLIRKDWNAEVIEAS